MDKQRSCTSLCALREWGAKFHKRGLALWIFDCQDGKENMNEIQFGKVLYLWPRIVIQSSQTVLSTFLGSKRCIQLLSRSTVNFKKKGKRFSISIIKKGSKLIKLLVISKFNTTSSSEWRTSKTSIQGTLMPGNVQFHNLTKGFQWYVWHANLHVLTFGIHWNTCSLFQTMHDSWRRPVEVKYSTRWKISLSWNSYSTPATHKEAKEN